jgi:hypothetical protein
MAARSPLVNTMLGGPEAIYSYGKKGGLLQVLLSKARTDRAIASSRWVDERREHYVEALDRVYLEKLLGYQLMTEAPLFRTEVALQAQVEGNHAHKLQVGWRNPVSEDTGLDSDSDPVRLRAWADPSSIAQVVDNWAESLMVVNRYQTSVVSHNYARNRVGVIATQQVLNQDNVPGG